MASKKADTTEGGQSSAPQRGRRFSASHVREIVSILESRRRGVRVSVPEVNDSLFSITYEGTTRRFEDDEAFFNVTVQHRGLRSLPDFLNNLRSLFTYFINVAKSLTRKGSDVVRFLFTRAPTHTWSLSLSPIEEFNVNMFKDVFKNHLQSGASEVLNKDWDD